MSDPIPAPADDLATRKSELRARMRDVRRTIPPDERADRGARAAGRLAALPEVARARTAFVFSSFGAEIPTEAVLARLVDDGHTVLLPFLAEGSMEASSVSPGDDLVATAYGPREPATRVAAVPASIDVVVLPGLAFDRAGNRLGSGGGHYDAYTDRLRPDAIRVGLCFHEQLLDDVPHGPNDRPVHLVITDREVVDCRPRRTGGR